MAAANLRRSLIRGKLKGTKIDGQWDVDPNELKRYDKTITTGRSRQSKRTNLKIACTAEEANAIRRNARSDPRGFSAWARDLLLGRDCAHGDNIDA